ncbi:MAG: hypothetical protein COB53_09915 [Elusimicrobia bacterium]|nr:MAG: hypothetical protein COB53_09915 [Elusimicrobiota bacterium]
MSEYQGFLVFFIGIFAGFINVMAGGGSALSLPFLIFLGLDGAVANGTNRIAIFLQNAIATRTFHQQRAYDFKTELIVPLWVLPGALMGALTATRVSGQAFNQVLVVVLALVVVSMFRPLDSQSKLGVFFKTPWIFKTALFLIGFYGGFIQVGVGFLIMSAVFHHFQISLVGVNRKKVLIVLVYTLPALLIFIANDLIDWKLGLFLALGNATGAWAAVKLSIKKGDKLVKVVMAAALVIVAAKLLFSP